MSDARKKVAREVHTSEGMRRTVANISANDVGIFVTSPPTTVTVFWCLFEVLRVFVITFALVYKYVGFLYLATGY